MIDYFKNKKKHSPSSKSDSDKMEKLKLIVTFTNFNETLNFLLMREQINTAFKNTNVNVIVTIIAKTVTKSKNIIIKILNNNSANDLIKHHHIWKSIVKPAKIVKNETWHKTLAHGVNIRFAMDMHVLKLEIEK